MKETKPLYVYSNVTFEDEDQNYIACRLPIIQSRTPFLRFIKTFPELAHEDDIEECPPDSAFKYYMKLNVDSSLEEEQAVLGDWVIVLAKNKYLVVHVVTHKEFLDWYNVEEENFFFDHGIILDHKFFRIATRIPLTTWSKYHDNDIDCMIERIQKNGGKIEYHNDRSTRKLRVHTRRTYTSQGKAVASIHPFELAYPGDWIVIDHGGNTLVYDNPKFLLMVDMEEREKKALL